VISCFISNYGEVKYSLIADKRNNSTFKKYIPFIQSQINDTDSNVAIIDSDRGYRMHTAFWLPYHYTITHDIPSGSGITRDMIPIETEYIILYDDYNPDLSLSSWRKTVHEGVSILHQK